MIFTFVNGSAEFGGITFESFCALADTFAAYHIADSFGNANNALAGVNRSAFIIRKLKSSSAGALGSTIFDTACLTTSASCFLAWVDLDAFVGSFAVTEFESFIATADGLTFDNVTFLVGKVFAV